MSGEFLRHQPIQKVYYEPGLTRLVAAFLPSSIFNVSRVIVRGSKLFMDTKITTNNYRRGFLKRSAMAILGALSLPVSMKAGNSDKGINRYHDEMEEGMAPDTNKSGFTILFQGDSITDGNRTRNNDWNHVMGHGYACLIASRLWYDHTDKGLHFLNRGISGNKVTDLAKRWQQDTIDLQPDLVSVLVGVNDADSMVSKDRPDNVSPEQYEKTLRQLLQQTKAGLPTALLVICEPFILPVGKVKENWDAWAADINQRQRIARKLAAESGHLCAVTASV